jgi:hypothetical protein
MKNKKTSFLMISLESISSNKNHEFGKGSGDGYAFGDGNLKEGGSFEFDPKSFGEF